MYKNKDEKNYLDYYIELFTEDLIHYTNLKKDNEFIKLFMKKYVSVTNENGVLVVDVKNVDKEFIKDAVREFCKRESDAIETKVSSSTVDATNDEIIFDDASFDVVEYDGDEASLIDYFDDLPHSILDLVELFEPQSNNYLENITYKIFACDVSEDSETVKYDNLVEAFKDRLASFEKQQTNFDSFEKDFNSAFKDELQEIVLKNDITETDLLDLLDDELIEDLKGYFEYIKNKIELKNDIVNQTFLLIKELLHYHSFSFYTSHLSFTTSYDKVEYALFLYEMEKMISDFDEDLKNFIGFASTLVLIQEIKVLQGDREKLITLSSDFLKLTQQSYYEHYRFKGNIGIGNLVFHRIGFDMCKILYYTSKLGHLNRLDGTVDSFKTYDDILENTFTYALEGIKKIRIPKVINELYKSLEIAPKEIKKFAKNNLELYQEEFMKDFISNAKAGRDTKLSDNDDILNEHLKKKIQAYIKGEHFFSVIHDLKVEEVEEKGELIKVYANLVTALVEAFMEEATIYLIEKNQLQKTKRKLDSMLKKNPSPKDKKIIQKYKLLFANRDISFTFFPIVYISLYLKIPFSYSYNFADEISKISNEKIDKYNNKSKDKRNNTINKESYFKHYCILSRILFPNYKANNQTFENEVFNDKNCYDIDLKE